MPNTITHVDKVYFQDSLIEWGYHMYQNQKSLLIRHYDYTAVLSYVSLKSGWGTYLTTHV